MNLDQRLFKLTWDTVTEYHKPHEMREKFAKTNLFGGDGVWTSPHPFLSTPCSNLEEVLSMIRPEEKWTCDNCTIELVDEPGVYVEHLGYASHDDWKATLPHDEQEMFQGYHGPSFKTAGIPCRFCGAEDTAGECDECTAKLQGCSPTSRR